MLSFDFKQFLNPQSLWSCKDITVQEECGRQVGAAAYACHFSTGKMEARRSGVRGQLQPHKTVSKQQNNSCHWQVLFVVVPVLTNSNGDLLGVFLAAAPWNTLEAQQAAFCQTVEVNTPCPSPQTSGWAEGTQSWLRHALPPPAVWRPCAYTLAGSWYQVFPNSACSAHYACVSLLNMSSLYETHTPPPTWGYCDPR